MVGCLVLVSDSLMSMPLDEATGAGGLVVFCGHLLALIVRHQAHETHKNTSLTASGI